MKTDLSKYSKYFLKEYNKNKREFELTEIPFNKENWFYVQIDASVRTTFLKYNCPIPSYVIVEKFSHYMCFYIVRDKIKNPKELLEWSEKWIHIKFELNEQAKCNSIEEYEDNNDYIKFEFKLI